MDYEKKYKEAQGWIEKIYPTLQHEQQMEAEAFFPELAESEDERIRKAIINVFSTHKDYEMFFGASVEDIRTWLEKQGKETNWKPSKEEMDVLYGLAYITNQYDEHKEEVITHLYQDLKREFFNGSSYENMFSTNTNTEDDVRRRNTIQVLEYARSLDAYNQYGKADIDKNIAWLERQGEQKPILNVPTREVILSIWDLGNEWKELTNGSISTEYGTQLDYIQKHWHESEYYLREKQDKQKVNYTTLAETGNGGINALVTREVSANDYEEKPADKVEPKFHEGEWIVQENIGTYKVIEVCESWYEVIDVEDNHYSIAFDKEYMCHLWTIQDAEDGDVLACENGWTCIFKCLNDNLFSSHCFMDHEGWFCKDGGQGHTLDNRICGEIYPATKEQRDTLFAKMKEAGYEWNAEKKELKKIEQKSAWSEEDEKKVNNLYVLLDQMVSFNMLSDKDATEFKDWLKSLKTRYTWKPSDEQMKALLSEVEAWTKGCPKQVILESLYNDLKKLKG